VSKRILLVGEFSGLATGYGNYSREVLGRLHAGGLEVAEYSSYVRDGGFDDENKREWEPPWPVFGVVPEERDPRFEAFKQSPHAQFGRMRFEEQLLKFRPDVCLTIRDPWVDSFVCESPFRPYFRHVWMPTVDSAPQQNDWLDMFAGCDATLAYTEWGAGVLRAQSGAASTRGGPPPRPSTRLLPPGPAAVQGRLRARPGRAGGRVPEPEPAAQVAPRPVRGLRPVPGGPPPGPGPADHPLLPHLLPGLGWDLPELLKEYGLLSKVLFTYLCVGNRGCGHAFPSFFASARAHCPRCGRPRPTCPGPAGA
jgi:hypothetical protein